MTNSVMFIFITLLFSAFFSGLEIAFLSSNKLRIELDKKQGKLSARILSYFLKKPGEFIVTMLIGNNIALVIYGILMAGLLNPFLNRYISSEFWNLIIQTLLSTLIILFLAEYLPKSLFRNNPNLFINILSVPVLLLYFLLYPVIRFSVLLSHGILRILFPRQHITSERLRNFGRVDLDFLVSSAETDEDLDSDNEIRLFQNALDFSRVRLRDCMIPRTEIVAIEKEASLEEASTRFIESGYSKILVYETNIDRIVGYVSSKDLFKNPPDLNSIIASPMFVPETMPANKLLKNLLQQHKSIAVVVDEFGGTAGLITIEDILEEIFGEIEDEHDTPDMVEKQTGTNEYIFSGRLEVEYLNEKYELGIPESEEYETLAGFILYHFQNLPKPNEIVQIDPFRIQILKMNNTRIDLVHLIRITTSKE
ncbi:MAG: hemolysin family protein [Bacteroidales bacterium]